MADGPVRDTAAAALQALRPRQWTKNLLVIAPLIFAGGFLKPALVARSLVAFAVFCLTSGAVYVVNDLRDAENDRVHAEKRDRPIASGRLSVPAAIAIAAACGAIGLAASALVSPAFVAVVVGFMVLQTAYTFSLKYLVILDVMTISAGFVLRAAAGAVAIGVSISPWLLACTALLSLFLGLSKRRHELMVLVEDAPVHRPVLEHYSIEYIDQMNSAVVSATIVAYALYTFFSATSRSHQLLLLTQPFVIYGLFRYLYLVHQSSLGGSPEEVLLTDRPLIVDILLYLVVAVIAISVG